jgi:HAD superfamily hydrolase (TIGR01509 family)
MTIKAILWDVDGTIAETERDGHRIAFNLAFEEFRLPWNWSIARYGELLAVTGGRERIYHDLRERGDLGLLAGERDLLLSNLHLRKNEIYGELVARGDIALRPGVRQLMEECRLKNVRMAITTTTSRSNVAALLSTHIGPDWASWFSSIVCGEDVATKKPDSEVFKRALKELGIGPLEALAIEDSPGGVAASRAADVPVIVTRSAYFINAGIQCAIAIGPGLDQRHGWKPTTSDESSSGLIGLDDLIYWRNRMEYTSDFG